MDSIIMYGLQKGVNIMKEKNKLQTIVTVTYTVVLLLILGFAVYMSCAERNSVYQARTIEQCEILKDYT